MPIILTSFKKSVNIKRSFPETEMFSVSRWQPTGFHYEVLEFLGAYDINGNKINLKGRRDPLNRYKNDLFKYYIQNWPTIQKWLDSIDNSVMISLSCWCPHSISTINQKKDFGTFACHTGLIGKIINKYRPDVEILMDKDRHLNLVPEWKPEKYSLINI